MSPLKPGDCDGTNKRYYFNILMSKCLEFDYTGCNGNLNNFESAKDCEITCDVLIEMAKQAESKRIVAIVF